MSASSMEGLHSLALAADKLSSVDSHCRDGRPQLQTIRLPPIMTEIEQWQAMNRPVRHQPQVDLPPFRDIFASFQQASVDTRQKMALDFIAPAYSDSGSSSGASSTPRQRDDPSRSPGLSSSASTYSATSQYLPSPPWSASPTFDLTEGGKSHHKQTYSITSLGSPLPMSPTFVPASIAQYQARSHHPTGPREDRHPYDDDERYALIYLRTVQNQKWDAVVAGFRQLFPPKEARRCVNASARGCPPSYVRRCVQGLQCRFYRIREEEGLKPLRDCRNVFVQRDESSKARPPLGGWKRERDILDRMVKEGRVHPDVVKACKEIGRKKGPAKL